MFTGIIEEVGRIKEIRKGTKSAVITIQGILIFEDLGLGDSVAVNGVCLTVSEYSKNTFRTDVMNETLTHSNLGELMAGSSVNLERAMAANGRFGGHMVSGHIDGVGTIANIQKDDNAILFTIRAHERILHYVVLKGSITIDGISLTITAINKTDFTISTIPHTIKSTILKQRAVGDKVNLENDLIGKYIEKFITSKPIQTPVSHLTKDFINKFGF